MIHMLDIVFVTAPITFTKQPLAAVALLGGMLKRHGYSYALIDVNAEINQNRQYHDPIIRFCLDYHGVGEADFIADHIETTASRILEKNARYVGISLFCYQSQNYTRLLCMQLKINNPNVKILLGGPGIISNGLNGDKNFAQELIDLGLADHYIRGEGDIALIEFLQTKKTDDQRPQILDLNELPFADYDEYDLSMYQEKQLTIIGSRGCVRRCTFCDIHQHWPQFTYRSGESIVAEMVHNSRRYGTSLFQFGDSLINGSMLAYRDFVRRLSTHNLSSEVKLEWESQFIFRPKNQMTDEDWHLTKLSGVRQLYVGVETMIENNRAHMGKKFTNQDMFASLDQCLQHDIKTELLMFVGYVTETEDDHLEELRIYEDLVKYKSILSIAMDDTLAILQGTPLYSSARHLNVTLSSKEREWVNENSNLDVRSRWLRERRSKIQDLGIRLFGT